MTSWPGYASAVPAGVPAPTPHWGPTRSPIYAARSAAAVDTIMRAQSGQNVDFSPAAGWAFDDTGLATTDAVDFVGGVTLASGGANAVRVQSVSAIDRAVHIELGDVAGYWSNAASANLDVGTTAFAFAARVRFSAVGTGSFWLSKTSNTATGYYGAGLDGTGRLSCVVRATDATVASTSPVGNLADSVWRWLLLGRSITNAVIWACSELGTNTAAFLAAKDLTTLARFGLWYNLFGTAQGGASGDVDHVLFFTGAPAENVFTNRLTLRTSMEALA
jgi:hypothetical protein